MKYLQKRNIFCGIHYPRPIHLQPEYKKKIIQRDRLKVTENISKAILTLPIYPELSIKNVKKISR